VQGLQNKERLLLVTLHIFMMLYTVLGATWPRR